FAAVGAAGVVVVAVERSRAGADAGAVAGVALGAEVAVVAGGAALLVEAGGAAAIAVVGVVVVALLFAANHPVTAHLDDAVANLEEEAARDADVAVARQAGGRIGVEQAAVDRRAGELEERPRQTGAVREPRARRVAAQPAAAA